MKYILDTDHVSLILRGDQRVLDRVALSGGEALTTVVTRNRRDFELVPGLQVVDWSGP